MKKIVKKILVYSMAVFLLLVIATIDNSKSITTSSMLNNKKIEWGIKRNNNHIQPDLGSENKRIIEANGDIAIGNKDEPFVYLTFDCGYEAGYTNTILDILKENNVKAAFFVTGHYVNSAGDLVQRMISEGHIVGNHTVNHYSIPEITLEKLTDEVMKLHQSVYEKFGYEMKYFRPPKGEYSEKTLSEIKKLGYVTVMWSFAYDDWDQAKQGREAYAKEKILSNIHNGCVMLLHATSKDNSNILDEVIKQIKEDGYEFKTLDEFHK